jgi:hypothetical protein
MTTTIAGPRVALRQGQRYRARAHVGKASFLVTDAAIRGALEDEGFSDVMVWRPPLILPKDWPADQRQVSEGIADFTAFIEATWALEDATRLRPASLVAMWVHPPSGSSSGTVTLPEVTIYGETAKGGSGTVTLPEVTITGDAPSPPGIGVIVAIAGAVGMAYGYRRAEWPGLLMFGALGAGAALAAGELVKKRATTSGGA